MDIDQMPVGIELDILIAEVLGYVRVLAGTAKKNPPGAETFVFTVADRIPSFADGVYIRHVSGGDFRRFAPSTNIAAAWEVVEKLHRLQFIVRLSISNGQYSWSQRWEIAIWRSVYRDSGLVVENCRKVPYEEREEVSFKAEANDAPLAICRVALKAMKERV